MDDGTEAANVKPVALAKRTFASFRRHDMVDRSAALTYYLVMSLFPGLLVVISLLGLLGTSALVTDAVGYLRDAGAPSEVIEPVRASLENLVATSGAKAGLGLLVGVLIGLNAASGAFGAAGRALNEVYGVDEDRGFVRRKVVDLGATLLILVLSIIGLVAVFLGGELADDVLGHVGLGSTGAAVWSVGRWLVAVLAIMLVFAIIYGFAPDRDGRRFRWISPGSVAGVLIWLAASGAFFLYVSNFGKYGDTYGAFAGAVVLLLWLYLTSLAFLLGGELNAEIERAETAGRAGPPFPTPPPSPADAAPPASQPGQAREATDSLSA